MRISILAIFLTAVFSCASEPVIIDKPHVREPLTMALVYHDDSMRDDAAQIKKLLMSTGLFDVKMVVAPQPVTQHDITSFMHTGAAVVLFIQRQSEGHRAWRLYDATDATMLVGKNTGTAYDRLTLRVVADAVYNHLFNHCSYFLTKIAYIQKNPTLRNKRRTELCLMDPVDGSSEVLLQDNRILVAPQWSRTGSHTEKIWITVSEFTPSNVRLIGVDLEARVWSMLDMSGTCVGTAQYNENTFVYVRSGALWLYEFDHTTKKGRHRRLTDGKMTSSCPSLLSSGDIIYSSQGKIYRYKRIDEKSYQLPVPGTCIAPDVHPATHCIIFSRLVKGIVQLHTCDSNGENVKQLTFGPGNKIDACWSPCGNYIAYTRTEGNREQIAIYNRMNDTEKIVTPPDKQCGYPSWSAPSLLVYA